MILYIVLPLVAYLLGSIPSAVWIGKRFYGVDVREHGSHNAGATNTLRVLGRRAALPVFIIDAAKGYVAVLLAHLTGLDGQPYFYFTIILTTAAILGHIFPIFAGFKGGKGVATMAGCLLGIAPVPMLLGMATFFIVLAVTRYVSAGSMTGGVLFPFYILLANWHDDELWPKFIFGLVVAGVLLITHRKNIKRLREGTESKTYLFIKRKNPEA